MINYYSTPIISAVSLFPFIALVFTLPYIIHQYRRFGSVIFLKTVVVYSFIFYMMCIYFLTILPLPSIESVAALKTPKILPIPFTDLKDALKDANFSIDDKSTWVAFLTGKGFFQILANIAMLVPFGIYMRYFFEASWKKCLLMTFLLSLSFELIQLSGLFFIYPRPYRFASTDDLITNTLGGMVGFWIAPLFMKILPSRDEMELRAYEKGKHIPILRQLIALIIDLAVVGGLSFSAAFLFNIKDNSDIYPIVITVASAAFFYFVLLQRIFGGRTFGKLIMKTRLVCNDKTDEDGFPKNANFFKVLYRYILLLGVYFPSPYAAWWCINEIFKTDEPRLEVILGLTAAICVLLSLSFVINILIYMFSRRKYLVIGRLSHTMNISTIEYAKGNVLDISKICEEEKKDVEA